MELIPSKRADGSVRQSFKRMNYKLFLLIAWMVSPLEGRSQGLQRIVIKPGASGLRFEYRFGEAEYRQQLLRIMPLGSSLAQVKYFSESELSSEQGHTDLPIKVQPELRETPYFISSQIFKWQPPLTKKITRINPHRAAVGNMFLSVWFSSKPSFWKSGILVATDYVFDGDSKLIDIYCSITTTKPSL